MAAPWSSLEAIRGLIGFPVTWQALAGAHYAPLKTLCLDPSTIQPESYPCPRQCGCWHRIVHRYDHTAAIGICRCQPPDCPDLELSLADITPLEVNLTKLGRALCRAFLLTTKNADLGLPKTAQIGSWSAQAVPVILTVQTEPQTFRRVVAELVASLNRPFILFAPTSAHLDAPSQQHLARVKAAFLPLESTATITPKGTLQPVRPPPELFAQFSPEPPQHNPHATPPTPRYALRKGLGVWHLTFDGQEAHIKHERGLFYVAYLLYNPPEQPIHALDLMAKIPEIYRNQLGLPKVADPATGKSEALQSHARIQERSLALDDAETMRALYRKEKELEAILDSEDESEPVKAEALRELEAIAEFQRHHGRRSKDSTQRAVDTLKKAIRRFHRNLSRALDTAGQPHPALRAFAAHLHTYMLAISARYLGPAHMTSRKAYPGCLTYEPPPGIVWTSHQ